MIGGVESINLSPISKSVVISNINPLFKSIYQNYLEINF